MKVKYDFVTNSSSTSFVMFGYVIKTKGKGKQVNITGEVLQDKVEDLGYQLFEGTEMGAPDDNSALIGVIIAEFNSEYPEEFIEESIDFEDLISKADQLKFDLGLPLELKPKLICTTRMS